jgi:hypothetical protein
MTVLTHLQPPEILPVDFACVKQHSSGITTGISMSFMLIIIHNLQFMISHDIGNCLRRVFAADFANFAKTAWYC